MNEETPKPWLRRDGETSKDYERFLIYRDLPPSRRNFEQAYLAWVAAEDEITGRTVHTSKRPPWNWYEIAKNNEWRSRALAWDDYRYELKRLEDEEIADMVRRKRRNMIDKQLDVINETLEKGNFAAMTPEEIRRYIDSFYNAFAKLLTASRAEMGDPTEITKNQTQLSGNIGVTSDDMAAAVQALQAEGFPVVKEPTLKE